MPSLRHAIRHAAALVGGTLTGHACALGPSLLLAPERRSPLDQYACVFVQATSDFCSGRTTLVVLLLLCAWGVGTGLLTRLRPLFLALLAVWIFPVEVLAAGPVAPEDRNLGFFELLAHGFMGLTVVVAVAAVRWLGARVVGAPPGNGPARKGS